MAIIFLLVLFASAFIDSTGASLLAGLLVLVVGGIGTAWITQRRKKITDKKEEEADIRQTQVEQGKLLADMHRAFVGEDPSPLNPNPPPGFVKVVPKLVKSVEKIEHTLYVNGGKGNTVIDRMERLEDALGDIRDIGLENQAISNRVEGSQVEQEGARKVRDHE